MIYAKTMKDEDDPQDFFSKMDDLRAHLAEMGEAISDDAYEDVLLQALVKTYEFIKLRHYCKRKTISMLIL